VLSSCHLFLAFCTLFILAFGSLKERRGIRQANKIHPLSLNFYSLKGTFKYLSRVSSFSFGEYLVFLFVFLKFISGSSFLDKVES